MRKAAIVIFITVLSIYSQSDFLAPSVNPPGGLSSDKVPQFVSIGFDDNGYADGLHWIDTVLQARTNPAGKNNPGTYDGTPARMTFFCTSNFGERFNDVKDAWKSLYQNGNEMGNHSWSHGQIDTVLFYGTSTEGWLSEMEKCNNFLINDVGVPADEITGFRTPFLGWGPNTFTALDSLNFLYDCSIEYTSDEWPYTLDNNSIAPEISGIGSPGKHPGMWEFHVPNMGGEVGFDYNMWFDGMTGPWSKEKFLTAMKSALDSRYNGNRRPLILGGHTEYYSAKWEQDNSWQIPKNATLKERQEAIEEFIDYALNLSDVRVVPMIKIVEWMRNPIALDAPVSINNNLTFKTKAYLNLKDSKLQITSQSNTKKSVALFDLKGKKIKQHIMKNSINISLKNISKGIYILNIRDHHTSENFKLRL